MLKRFHFDRCEDASGVSGIGRVAEGCLFSDGKVVLHWESKHSSINIYNSISDLLQIHGHEGRTKIIWDD